MVVEGDGIVVTGNGSAANPYVVTATGGGGGDVAAADVSFTPVGTIVSTNAQDAIAEVDDALSTHLADPTDAHNASAISFVPAGTIAATEVQAAIEEVATEAASTYEVVNTVAATGATETIPDPNTASLNHFTLDANCTLTFPTAAAGKSFTLVLVQDGAGSRTVTWPGTVQWPGGGTAPTLTTAAAGIDVMSFMCADGTNWLGFVAGQDFS